jgi:hypothetical protein
MGTTVHLMGARPCIEMEASPDCEPAGLGPTSLEKEVTWKGRLSATSAAVPVVVPAPIAPPATDVAAEAALERPPSTVPLEELAAREQSSAVATRASCPVVLVPVGVRPEAGAF